MKAIRYSYLDSARGIAAIIVVIHHYFLEFGNFSFEGFPNLIVIRFFSDGMSSVRFFFVLSGFVLSLSLLKEEYYLTFSKYCAFVVSRFFRILPLYFTYLFFSLIAYIYLYKNIATYPTRKFFFGASWSDPLIIKKIWKEATLYINQQRSYGFIPQGWSLTYEILNSLLIPFLIILSRYSTLLATIFVFILLKFFNFNNYIFDFFLGITVAQYHSSFTYVWQYFKISWKVLIVLFALSLFAINTIIPPYLTYYFEYFFFSLSALGSGLIICIMISSPKIQEIFNNKIMVTIGQYSFGIYLSHMLIINAIIPYLINFTNQYTLNYNVNHAIGLFGTLLLAFLLSIPLFYIIEKPFIHLGRSLVNKLKK